MEKVLFIGQLPETVDFADPALPPGTHATRSLASAQARSALGDRTRPGSFTKGGDVRLVASFRLGTATAPPTILAAAADSSSRSVTQDACSQRFTTALPR